MPVDKHKQEREVSDMIWLENMKWELLSLQAKNDLDSKYDALLLKLRQEGVLK